MWFLSRNISKEYVPDGEGLFELKGNSGKRTKVWKKSAISTFSLEIFLTIQAVRVCSVFSAGATRTISATQRQSMITAWKGMSDRAAWLWKDTMLLMFRSHARKSQWKWKWVQDLLAAFLLAGRLSIGLSALKISTASYQILIQSVPWSSYLHVLQSLYKGKRCLSLKTVLQRLSTVFLITAEATKCAFQDHLTCQPALNSKWAT